MTQTYNESFLEAITHGTQGLLHEWGIPETGAVSLLNISENATFVAHDPDSGKKIILRVHRPDYHTRQEIESELIWIDSLREQKIVKTAAPLELVSGGRIASFAHDGVDRLVVGFEFLPGDEPLMNTDLTGDFYTLGSVTARLHEHVKAWATPVGFKRKVWDFDSMLGQRPLWGDWRDAMGLDNKCKAVLEKTADLLARDLDAYGSQADRFGLVHADLRLANLLVGQGELSVIDFDDCGYSWFMYDFAAAISFMEEDIQIPDLKDSWVKGYRSVAYLSPEEEQSIPMFIMLRRMLLTAWLASHREAETAQQLGQAYTQGTVRLAQTYLNTSTIFA
jgi:Ser/Thr protein kinase RdoA (MazF antagonist)